jgi:hypothetical protein
VDLFRNPTPVEGSSISLEAEVPEVLFSVITSALAGFLFQNGCSDQSVTQHYLDGLFLQR